MNYDEFVTEVLPRDHMNATLVGRIFDPVEAGPSVVAIRQGLVVDISHIEPTVSSLFEREDLTEIVREETPRKTWKLEDVLLATLSQDCKSPHFLTPIDLQVVKAAGVTFVHSMIERVIEERAIGDPMRAESIRAQLNIVVGGSLSNVRPGSPEAQKIKEVLMSQNLWSQYLEVGIGPDPEVFTKAPVLSAVGLGAAVGVLERSTWNNPEPELVLAVTSKGEPVGAALGNDVNLRDFEGRSALLLAEAKDNNASCAIGPFVRLFDQSFTLQSVRELEIRLQVKGLDGFEMDGVSSMTAISRDVLELVKHSFGDHHQYPDGFVLFTGTLFAPTKDRDQPGAGFTHHRGDTVVISTPQLGSLINHVMTSEAAPNWTIGIMALMRNLVNRGLLPST